MSDAGSPASGAMPRKAVIISASVTLVVSVLILILSSIATAYSTPHEDEVATSNSTAARGTSGAVVGLSAVWIVLAIVTLAMYSPRGKAIKAYMGTLSPLPGGRYLGSGAFSSSYGSLSSSSMFASGTPAF